MNVIFLDVDGVLNNAYTKDRISGYMGIDDNKVILLKTIVDEFDAKIILSSTWRHDVDKDIGKYLVQKLDSKGLSIYACTPDIGWHSRAKEIVTWLNAKEEPIENVVILDDEYFNWDEYQLEQYWVPTEYYSENGGLTTDIVNGIINNKERFIYNKGE